MKTQREYLEAARKAINAESDGELGRAIGVSRQYISKYLKREVFLNPTECALIAGILKIEPIKVIADIQLQKAKTPKERKVWEKFSKAAMVGFLAVIAMWSTPYDTQAKEISFVNHIHYAHYPRCFGRCRMKRHPGLQHIRAISKITIDGILAAPFGLLHDRLGSDLEFGLAAGQYLAVLPIFSQEMFAHNQQDNDSDPDKCEHQSRPERPALIERVHRC